ncbi:helix-turn-helix domain-containing protein [Paraburkholderia sp. JHI869]|uniref:helix-turn-helix domain-containing protein n=1 Tax=Paraburkholderia sp. JHI869 TaxID=3112959 RepID=UPI00316D4CAA
MQCKFEGTVTLGAGQAAQMSLGDARHPPAATLAEPEVVRIAVRAVQLYAESHPRPTQVNQKQAAEMLGVSARTVHNLIKANTLRLNKCGMIPIELVDKARA